MSEKYVFCELTEDHIEKIVANWLVEQQNGIPEDLIDIAQSSYDRLLTWMEKGIKSQSPNEHGFFILQRADDQQYLAIIEMTDARQGKDPAFKLLNVFFCPKLNLEFKDSYAQKDLKEIEKVLEVAFTKATGHAFANNCKFKMYGRTEQIALLFETLLTANKEQNPYSFSVRRQSRWLVIERN